MVSLSTWLDEYHPTTSPEDIGKSNGMLEARLPLFGIQDDQIERRLSDVARNQSRSIAVGGIEETELEIFFAFVYEKFWTKTPRCRHHLAVSPTFSVDI
jgi:hypothetical protein